MSPRPHLHSDLSRLDGLVRQLPFDLDDGEAVGALFTEWRRSRRRRSAHLLDLWTYCYVHRYFLLKFVRAAEGSTAGDLEMVIDRAFRKVSENRASVKDPRRYPHWVTVICRNVFVNHVTRHPGHISVDRIAEPAQPPDTLEAIHDDAIRAGALDGAINRLPRHLRIVARLRLVQDLAYEVISERTGIAVPSIRAYVHKALLRLRKDRRFLEAMGYEHQLPGSDQA
ncbi:MAG: sigma-70 family RNA polymerase sigma factor [Rhodothermales bacterium]|nr:sigma-70 family RNA polymerase sigma factor [Rhodothermales bacterium]